MDGILKELGITNLILSGMQTDFCLDTSIKVAFEKGYKLHILDDSFSTYDMGIVPAKDINAHYKMVWNYSFGNVLSLDELKKFIKEKNN